MEIRELTALQQQAINAFTKFHQVDFSNAEEVLHYLTKVHPYMNNINLNLPKEQLFYMLNRHGYGKKRQSESRVQQAIRNLMADIQIEDFLNWGKMKQASRSIRSQIIH
jgi:hypothetical protein